MAEQRVDTSAPARPGVAGRVLAVASVVALVAHLAGLYAPTGPPTPPWFPAADKVEHAIGFGGPLLLILLTLDRFGVGSGRRRVELGVVLAFAAHAVVSELIQHFFYTMRAGDPLDVLADWAGVLLGWVAYRLIRRRRAVTP